MLELAADKSMLALGISGKVASHRNGADISGFARMRTKFKALTPSILPLRKIHPDDRKHRYPHRTWRA
jgi:hypothetical protein